MYSLRSTDGLKPEAAIMERICGGKKGGTLQFWKSNAWGVPPRSTSSCLQKETPISTWKKAWTKTRSWSCLGGVGPRTICILGGYCTSRPLDRSPSGRRMRRTPRCLPMSSEIGLCAKAMVQGVGVWHLLPVKPYQLLPYYQWTTLHCL